MSATAGPALVVLSGGLDSTVCMALARASSGSSPPPLSVTFDYGQRHRRELAAARSVAHHYGSEHLVVALDVGGWRGSALTDESITVPVHEPFSQAPDGSRATSPGPPVPVTYVPGRNLIFLSIAAGIAESRDLDAVYIGVNAMDYSGYPDCRPEFIESFSNTVSLAQKRGVEGRPVEIVAPLLHMTKADIVSLGIDLDAPLELTWSCYQGGTEPCGVCDA
ncbi:MAG: 7-cyano-7-deazaguanine synthase QueC [Acidimicrobiales bacterium]